MPVLTQPGEAGRIMTTLHTMHSAGDLDLHAATIMPDHVHLLFTLGESLTLGQTMAKFKNLARDLGRVPWRWLDDGFEHRLRSEETVEDYGHYIFMNPYRARLIPSDAAWPWWHCPEPRKFQFMDHLSVAGTPPSEWLDTIEETATRIATGE